MARKGKGEVLVPVTTYLVKLKCSTKECMGYLESTPGVTSVLDGVLIRHICSNGCGAHKNLVNKKYPYIKYVSNGEEIDGEIRDGEVYF